MNPSAKNLGHLIQGLNFLPEYKKRHFLYLLAHHEPKETEVEAFIELLLKTEAQYKAIKDKEAQGKQKVFKDFQEAVRLFSKRKIKSLEEKESKEDGESLTGLLNQL